MSSFTSPLKVEYIDGKNWKLTRPFTYHLNSKHGKAIIKVPIGFETNFASIPKLFRPVIGQPTNKGFGKASVIHDYLYTTHQYSRKKSDQIFLEAMQISGVPKFKRGTMYYTLRFFGRRAWKKSKFV